MVQEETHKHEKIKTIMKALKTENGSILMSKVNMVWAEEGTIITKVLVVCLIVGWHHLRSWV